MDWLPGLRGFVASLPLGCYCAISIAAEPLLDEIVVTARKREELLRRVPLAVTVLGAQSIREASIQSLQDIAAHTPGLGYEAQFAAGGGVPTMRGQSPPNAPADNVAVFVDGVYQAEQGAYDAELLDMQRVEVINGPQSSLFGHSSFAGAIHYLSREPTPVPEWGYQLDAGSDAWGGVQGWLSGPLLNSGWLGRVAASWRAADGNLAGDVPPDELGGFKRSAVALSLMRDVEAQDDWVIALRLRHNASEMQHPYVSSLSGADYNCGGIDPTTGFWSYYCGKPAIVKSFDLSAGLPDSRSETSQLGLSLEIPFGDLRIESLGSLYRADVRQVRDFDASSSGLSFGVCTPGITCPGNGVVDAPVDRLVNVNEVQVRNQRTEEFSQEIRLRNSGDARANWLLGAVFFYAPSRSINALGAERGDLQINELLTTYSGNPPYVARAVSLVNEALVTDPNQQQIQQSRRYQWRKTWALFGTVDFSLSKALRLRVEGRYTSERQHVNSVTENFDDGLGEFPTGHFEDFTPRLSIDYSFSGGAMLYASAAKGSRSGGINTIPGLSPDEQSFDPEYNWTYEVGGRYVGGGVFSTLNLTLYGIRWRNAQIVGFSSTPGINNLITLNTGGIDASGLEISTTLTLLPWLRGEMAYSRVDSRFGDNSDDPSSRAFCGLVGGNTTSTFCTVGAPRQPTPDAITLVPWLDDNFVARVPRTMWVASSIVNPDMRLSGWRLTWRLDLSHQTDMYERSLENLRFGERRLLDSRISLIHGPWSLELWGRNLTDDRYHRSSFSRGNLFFPNSTRPIDFLYGEGRRVGIALRYEH